jgi:hypothetical protein
MITVDTDNAENNLKDSGEELKDIFETQGFIAEIESVFITAAPTLLPTITPSFSPVTTIPSAVPTITGAVASVRMTGVTTEDISDEEYLDIVTGLADVYGVEINDIDAKVEYVLSGTLDILVPDDANEDEIIDALQDSVSKCWEYTVKM